MQDDLRVVNRLEERGFVDRWGFVLFAFGGSIAIIAAKHFGSGAVTAAVGAVVLLLGYACLIHLRGTGKLRSDQAGDNCYYLGLLYTLSSLAYAIFTFDPANTATTIVQGFGIALASTIAGLVLRVFFNQSRVDLYEIEDTARLELAQAAGRLKAELSQIAVSFSDFGHQTRQIVGEVRDAALVSIDEGAARSIKTVTDVADAAHRAIEDQTSELAAKARRLGAATDKAAEAIEVSAGRIGVAAEAAGRFGHVASRLQKTTDHALQAAGDLVGQVADASTIHALIAENSQQALGNTQAMADLLKEISASLTRLHADFDERLNQIETVSAAHLQNAFAGISECAADLEKGMKRLLEVHRESTSQLHEEASSTIAALRARNLEIATELRRPRETLKFPRLFGSAATNPDEIGRPTL